MVQKSNIHNSVYVQIFSSFPYYPSPLSPFLPLQISIFDISHTFFISISSPFLDNELGNPRLSILLFKLNPESWM